MLAQNEVISWSSGLISKELSSPVHSCRQVEHLSCKGMSLRSTGYVLSSPWCSFLPQWWCSAFWDSAQGHVCASGYIQMLLLSCPGHLCFQPTFISCISLFCLCLPLPLASTDTPLCGAGLCQSIWKTWPALPVPFFFSSVLFFFLNLGDIHIIHANFSSEQFTFLHTCPNSKHFCHSQR